MKNELGRARACTKKGQLMTNGQINIDFRPFLVSNCHISLVAIARQKLMHQELFLQ